MEPTVNALPFCFFFCANFKRKNICTFQESKNKIFVSLSYLVLDRHKLRYFADKKDKKDKRLQKGFFDLRHIESLHRDDEVEEHVILVTKIIFSKQETVFVFLGNERNKSLILR